MKPAAPDALLQACGAAGPLQVLVVGPTENDRRQFLINRGFVIVGRHPRACVSLEDERIGPRHLYLQILDGQLYGIDLGSQSGAFRGMTRFTSGWAAPGSFFRLDPYHLSVQFGRSPNAGPLTTDDPISHPIPDLATLPTLRADILVGNARVTRWKMTRRLVLIGREPSARLRLRDRSISRFHAVLVGTPQGIWVVDLLSREGTWVNGNRTPFARLRSGDRLRVGCYDLYLQIVEPTTPLPALPAPPGGLMVPASGQGAGLPNTTNLSVASGSSLSALSPDALALVPILQQFGLFQQQMLDQFQQSLMLMLQTFAKMNNDQMELIRDELAELRRLTEDLHEARQQLATPAKPTPTPAPAPEPQQPPRGNPTNGTRQPPSTPIPSTTVTPTPSSSAEPPPPDAEVHDWLSQRIANLESQREGLLKRVFRKLSGG